MILREEYYLDGLNCDPFSFASECQELNSYYHKNKNFNEIKSHHYIISFDPKDRDECGLTGERAQQLGLTFAKKNFPGHQALVCTHTDGHNESGNIHVHIVINSLRKYDIPQKPYMEFDCEAKAGYKHHLSTASSGRFYLSPYTHAPATLTIPFTALSRLFCLILIVLPFLQHFICHPCNGIRQLVCHSLT